MELGQIVTLCVAAGGVIASFWIDMSRDRRNKDLLSKEHDRLTSEHEGLSKEHSGLSKEHEEIRAENSRLLETVKEGDEKIQSAVRAVQNFTIEERILRENSSRNGVDVNRLIADVEALAKNSGEADGRIKQIQMEASRREAELTAKIEEIQDINQRMQNMLDSVRTEKDELKNEISHLREQNAELKGRLLQMQRGKGENEPEW